MSQNPHSLESNLIGVFKFAQRIHTADAYLFYYFAHLTAGCNLFKLFVDCQVIVIVCLCKYNKCSVLSIKCNVMFLTYLVEGL